MVNARMVETRTHFHHNSVRDATSADQPKTTKCDGKCSELQASRETKERNIQDVGPMLDDFQAPDRASCLRECRSATTITTHRDMQHYDSLSYTVFNGNNRHHIQCYWPKNALTHSNDIGFTLPYVHAQIPGVESSE
ncbi:hypothetical protein WAI453_011938 [Rhynchosporium graminicola]